MKFNHNIRANGQAAMRLLIVIVIAILAGCGGSGGSGSAPAAATPPAIQTQPASASVALSGALSLNVAASGSGLGYQWYLDGIALLGATNSTYAITSANVSDAGTYTVIVTNTNGSATSNTATIAVTGTASNTTKTQAAPRVIVAAATGQVVQFPSSTTSWQLTYSFVVPPLPTGTWDASQHTFYIWGDVDFDTYGGNGAYPLSSYVYNQIVPQLFIGRVLSGNNVSYTPSWTQQNTWAIQAQYFWQLGSTPYAQTGNIVNVVPGDNVTTTISYGSSTHQITASISAPEGQSTIVIARPFPNQPGLFTDWADFFAKAKALSGGKLITQPVVTVEPHGLDKQTLCSVLPFAVKGVTIPSIGSSSSAYALYLTQSLPCAAPVVGLNF